MQRFLPILICALGAPLASAQTPAKNTPIEQVIDRIIDKKLKDEKVTPAPLADDAAILRRLTLDLNGRTPTLAELDQYLADTDPAKKAKLVDRLLASPAFIRHQTAEFTTYFQPTEQPRKGADNSKLTGYLAASFKDNKAWDVIFREMMVADESDAKVGGAATFLKARIKDLNKVTIDVSTRFFGVNVSCAQCHDHPHVSDWTQDHFYGMKSFFARTMDNGGVMVEKDFGSVKYIPNKGTEKVAPVMFLTGKKLDVPGMKDPTGDEKKKEQKRIDESKKAKKAVAPDFSLRAKLVDTALAPDARSYFARNLVNRLWYRFYGRGLVMPLDQMHRENPATHPELLDWLAKDLTDHNYDIRRLVRGLVLSNTYARSTRWENGDPPDEKLFAVGHVRALTPTQMATSLKIATTDPATLPGDKQSESKLDSLEKSAESMASLFPHPTENFQVGVAEAMLFANNEGLEQKLLQGPTSLPARLAQEPDSTKRAQLAVRTVLNRPARPEEIEAIASYLDRRGDRSDAACRQVVWALITSAEFRFNH
jgi:hypothetical protein